MTLDDFEAAIANRRPLPADTAPLVVALWHDATGDWEGAHSRAQDIESNARRVGARLPA